MVNIVIVACSYTALVDEVLNADTLKWKFSLDLIKLCKIQRIFTMLRGNRSGALGYRLQSCSIDSRNSL